MSQVEEFGNCVEGNGEGSALESTGDCEKDQTLSMYTNDGEDGESTDSSVSSSDQDSCEMADFLPAQSLDQGEGLSVGSGEIRDAVTSSDIENTAASPESSAHAGTSTINPRDAVIDETIFPRVQDHDATIELYAQSWSRGAIFPPIDIEARTNRVLGGVHRLKSLKLHTSRYPDLLAEYQKAFELFEQQGGEAPIPPAAPPDEIACTYHTIPDGVHFMLYSYGLNSTHGLRPTPADRLKTLRTVYVPGMPLSTLASYTGVSPRLVKQDLGDLISAYDDERRGIILKGIVDGLTNDEIASALAEKYPHGKGISASSVSRSIAYERENLGKSRLAQDPKKPDKSETENNRGGILSAAATERTAPQVTGGSPDDSSTSPPAVSNQGKPTDDTGSPIAQESAAPEPIEEPASPAPKASQKEGAGAGSKGGGPKTAIVAPVSPKTTESPKTPKPDDPLLNYGDPDSRNLKKFGVTVLPYDAWISPPPNDYVKSADWLSKQIGGNLIYHFCEADDIVVNPLGAVPDGRLASILSNICTLELAAACKLLDNSFMECCIQKDGLWPKNLCPDLIFLSIHSVPSSTPAAHLDAFHGILALAFQNVEPGCRIAVLCEEWIGNSGDALLVFDYAAVIKSVGWKLARTIQAPLTPLVDPWFHTEGRRNRLLSYAKYIIIGEKVLPKESVEMHDTGAASAPELSAENAPVVTPEAGTETEVPETDVSSQKEGDDSAADAPEPSTENVSVEAPDEDAPVVTPVEGTDTKAPETDSFSQTE